MGVSGSSVAQIWPAGNVRVRSGNTWPSPDISKVVSIVRTPQGAHQRVERDFGTVAVKPREKLFQRPPQESKIAHFRAFRRARQRG